MVKRSIEETDVYTRIVGPGLRRSEHTSAFTMCSLTSLGSHCLWVIPCRCYRTLWWSLRTRRWCITDHRYGCFFNVMLKPNVFPIGYRDWRCLPSFRFLVSFPHWTMILYVCSLCQRLLSWGIGVFWFVFSFLFLVELWRGHWPIQRVKKQPKRQWPRAKAAKENHRSGPPGQCLCVFRHRSFFLLTRTLAVYWCLLCGRWTEVACAPRKRWKYSYGRWCDPPLPLCLYCSCQMEKPHAPVWAVLTPGVKPKKLTKNSCTFDGKTCNPLFDVVCQVGTWGQTTKGSGARWKVGWGVTRMRACYPYSEHLSSSYISSACYAFDFWGTFRWDIPYRIWAVVRHVKV